MKTILVTGGTGLVGQAVGGHIHHGCHLIGSKDCDFRNWAQTQRLFSSIEPDVVIHLAGRVGGVKANTLHMAEFFRDNITINTNVLHAAHVFNVDKVVSLMSTCIYPDDVQYPIKEESLHLGEPHVSNYGYAHAKRMLDIQSRAYRQQYGCNFVTLIPNNIYGPFDNFDLENSHVIPAMIRKFHAAKEAREPVKLWGNGSPIRQFSYSWNIASVIIWAVDNYHSPEPMNIGHPVEYSIKETAEIVADKLDFRGEIVWDTSQPAGQFRKTVSFDKLAQTGYDNKWTSLSDGLEQTCDWYNRNYPNVRGL